MVAELLRIYLDEDVDVLLARLLGSRGFHCVSASELGHLAWTDAQHLEFAAGQGAILITHNRVDFENLARQWWDQSKNHAGIVLAFRRANTHVLLRRLLPVLACYDQSGWRNVVMYA
jgi:predicted nuclease of predicted toxin-antitoxin system